MRKQNPVRDLDQDYNRLVLCHLGSAYNLAVWLMGGNSHDAEDAVQDACVRAFQAFETLRKTSSYKAWFLTIVRNRCFSLIKKRRWDEEIMPEYLPSINDDPEEIVIHNVDLECVRDALNRLPAEYREVIILREMEEFSYTEISQITDTPIGTVMSRLSRARKLLSIDLKGSQMIKGNPVSDSGIKRNRRSNAELDDEE